MVAEAMAQRALEATTEEADGGSEVGVREREATTGGRRKWLGLFEWVSGGTAVIQLSGSSGSLFQK